MTYKLSKMSTATYDCARGAILNRPNLAALIGCIVAEWAQLEVDFAAYRHWHRQSGWQLHVPDHLRSHGLQHQFGDYLGLVGL